MKGSALAFLAILSVALFISGAHAHGYLSDPLPRSGKNDNNRVNCLTAAPQTPGARTAIAGIPFAVTHTIVAK